MLTRITDRFGPASLVVAIIALIVALSGAAYAASGGLTGKQKKEVEKIAKKYAGENGAPGTPGAPGTSGQPGAKGDKGDPGTNGTNGANGKSVVTGNATPAECSGSNPAGGATVEVAGEPATKKKACNGKEGSPWTVGGVLPPGETLTGVWSAVPGPAFSTERVPISFSIPLAEELVNDEACLEENPPSGTVCKVHYINKDGEEVRGNFLEKFLNPSPFCHGTAGEPSAEPGHLCVYSRFESNAELASGAINRINETGAAGGASKVGAAMLVLLLSESSNAYGSWAVTAAE
jgi:Collagen triple helix repeat (20 copies)